MSVWTENFWTENFWTENFWASGVAESDATVVACSAATGELFDEFVQAADTSFNEIGNSGIGAAQSWQSESVPKRIPGVCVRLQKDGSPTGAMKVSIYAHSGTYGTSSVPTGSALVSSVDYDVSSISASATDYYFPFSTTFVPAASTSYTVVVEDVDIVGDVSNRVRIIIEGGAEATHGGNSAINTGSGWTAQATTDMVFKIYSVLASVGSPLSHDLIRSGVFTDPVHDPTKMVLTPVRKY